MANNNESKLDLENKVEFPLTRTNFMMMAASALLIIVGFLLMLGPSTTADAFNPDIFSTRRIIVGPAISFIGFIAMAVAIIYRNKKA